MVGQPYLPYGQKTAARAASVGREAFVQQCSQRSFLTSFMRSRKNFKCREKASIVSPHQPDNPRSRFRCFTIRAKWIQQTTRSIEFGTELVSRCYIEYIIQPYWLMFADCSPHLSILHQSPQLLSSTMTGLARCCA